MVAVLTVEVLYVQRGASSLGEGLKPLLKQLGVHLADFRPRQYNSPDQVGPLAEINGNTRQGLVHRHRRLTPAADADAVAKRLCHSSPNDDAGVLGGVVLVGVQIAFSLNFQIDQTVARKLLQHMIEETDSGRHLITA